MMFQTTVALNVKTVPQNASRINMEDDLKYWCKRFGVTPTRLQAAVEKVGDYRHRQLLAAHFQTDSCATASHTRLRHYDNIINSRFLFLGLPFPGKQNVRKFQQPGPPPRPL
jgi:Protein of unknown function (DUF3606)